MDQATTWTGKLSLTELPYRLCPNLQRLFVRATMIGTRMKALPASVVAWLPICAEKSFNAEVARFWNDDTYARKQFPQDQASAADLRHTRSTEFESIAKERALAQAERKARGMYKKLADKLLRRRSQRIVQAIADGELRFAGRVVEQVDVLIPPHLAGSLQVDAQTVSLPPHGDDRGMVWRDVFVSCREEPAPPAATPPPDIAEWTKALVANVERDGCQLARKQFDEAVRHSGARLPNGDHLREKDVGQLWRDYTPTPWRRRNQGSIPKAKRVIDWHKYLPA